MLIDDGFIFFTICSDILMMLQGNFLKKCILFLINTLFDRNI
jgi:hypothetical protein